MKIHLIVLFNSTQWVIVLSFKNQSFSDFNYLYQITATSNQGFCLSNAFSTKLTPAQIASYEEVKDLPNHPDKLLVDVREPSELIEFGQIPTSINIPCELHILRLYLFWSKIKLSHEYPELILTFSGSSCWFVKLFWWWVF